MSQSDAPKPKPPLDKPPPPPPKPPDWGTLGWLIVALFLFIIAIGNASGFGDSQNRPLTPSFDRTESDN
ncbi:hypothetical protein [Planktothrix agardhii]|jgi:hypothetical protein|uniref:Uncharacterized protein n=1 Tax=Planktothrix agardhii TaxID=1160 RepID=A0AAD1PZR8_PLAAG|nr:hypothetical protein [Planktothrix agardhii]MCB8776072.1 hypothetical protein [Planktothrix agardhii 1031]MCF3591654.1 hypothetical protein [Planktothrix agardhii 1029]MCF3600419.1 hypothetical protein [Planktothrix agardhii 1032]MCF3618880.1 hypothetical protein [Planktothrix agardhii 1030]MCP9294044.1 hypothetical protein [Planktothrix agardhii LY1]